MASDLNQSVPLGVPASRRWLLSQGITASRLDNALKSGKLRSLVSGVYARDGLPVGWEGVVCALQREFGGIVVGGFSALDLQGRGHYLQLGAGGRVHLYGPGREPRWLSRLPRDVEFLWHGTARLWDGALEPGSFQTQRFSWREDLEPLVISSPERALLEVLAQVPGSVTFELAGALVQGLTSLSPGRLEEVLHACVNVKAKRLFFWFALRTGYAWSKKLNPDDFDLGSGKRVVAQGGKLDSRFLITVPEDMYGDG